MIGTGRRVQTRSVQSARTRSSSHARISFLENMELEERLFRSLEESKELKKKNNLLREDVRMLKARLRWPPHIQEAVLSKENQQEDQLLRRLETTNIQMMEKCQFYERTIRQLEDRLEVKRDFDDHLPQLDRSAKPHAEQPQITISERNGDKAPTAAVSNTQVAAMKQALDEWKDHANCYKQQAGEAVARLKDTEERLAQMLRLHTLDSAELIRTSRTSKHAIAQLTATQEDNRHYKEAIEKMQEKFGEITAQLESEKLRNVELQENLAQVQQLRMTNADLHQEIDEVKQERSVMQTRLQGLVRETAEAGKAECESSQSLRRQVEAMRAEHSAQQKALKLLLEERGREVADLTTQQDALRQQLRTLQHQKRSTHEPPTKEVATDHKITQTINLEVDLKPPEATVELSNEESDRMLSQMNDELEQYKQMMRSMQSMCETYKKELADMHEQLQSERKSYARQLSLEMTQFKALQEQLKGCANLNTMVVTAEVEPPPKPKPRPRKMISKVQSDERVEKTELMKELLMEIESLSLPKGSFLLKKPDLQKFFIDFKLSGGGEDTSHETPGNYPLPSSPSKSVAVGHKHRWHMTNESALESFIQFDLVAENEEEATDECTEIGVGKLPLTELMAASLPNVPFNMKVPVCIDEDKIVAHLKVALTKIIQ